MHAFFAKPNREVFAGKHFLVKTGNYKRFTDIAEALTAFLDTTNDTLSKNPHRNHQTRAGPTGYEAPAGYVSPAK